jgi:DNA-binding response OmpR family regulator
MNLDRHEVRVEGKSIQLTPKEFQILRVLLQNPGRVLTRQALLNLVWGEDYALEEHALDVHIHALRQKLEYKPSVPQWIVTVRGVGYKLSSD